MNNHRIIENKDGVIRFLLRALTPKVLLCPVGTIWTSGRLVQFQFMLRFFEDFIEDVVFYKRAYNF